MNLGYLVGETTNKINDDQQIVALLFKLSSLQELACQFLIGLSSKKWHGSEEDY